MIDKRIELAIVLLTRYRESPDNNLWKLNLAIELLLKVQSGD